jgi:hypothetical protein
MLNEFPDSKLQTSYAIGLFKIGTKKGRGGKMITLISDNGLILINVKQINNDPIKLFGNKKVLENLAEKIKAQLPTHNIPNAVYERI